MVTSYDIIFLWVARMVMLGLHFMHEIPFTTVFCTPLVFDLQGRKMSKSLGNAIDPMTDLVPLYGADGFRFGIVRQMRLESQELRFDERYCDEAKRFCTKLWNALRYTVALDEGLPAAGTLPLDALTVADRWILSELRACIETVSSAYDGFTFGVAADALLQFGWYTFCDWYLEATKAPGQSETRGAVLSFVLNAFARTLHPIAPFVSEEIWLTLPHDGATIVTASWPDVAEIPDSPQDAETFRALIAKVEELRQVRAEWGIGPREPVRIAIPAALNAERGIVETLATLARADVTAADDAGGGTLVERIAAVRAVADRAKLLDFYQRKIGRGLTELERAEKKLANPGFVAKAAPDVVAGERTKAAGLRDELERIRRALDELA